MFELTDSVTAKKSGSDDRESGELLLQSVQGKQNPLELL
jgi:hypothetical protein